MAPAFEDLPRKRDETGQLWVYVFGRWTPVAEPDGGAAGVPARLPDGPPPLVGRPEAGPSDFHDQAQRGSSGDALYRDTPVTDAQADLDRSRGGRLSR
jgi:hypothetical protein